VTVNVPVPLVPAENTAISPGVQAPVADVPALLVLQKLLVSQVPVGVVAVPVAVPLLSQYRSAFEVKTHAAETSNARAKRLNNFTAYLLRGGRNLCAKRNFRPKNRTPASPPKWYSGLS
jgi:hypothetical protein